MQAAWHPCIWDVPIIADTTQVLFQVRYVSEFT